ncbi:hypothetical protein GQ55_8G254600 [Panicum hallii var. hallii]|uniref:Retrovirus-related Pol polyprotein from transposon TNT 1-94-like beta-barrel domain-containing protein n=1 Tax=Panicum hallii var. hallii TaxID=1504633 RepID=A0A2T7CR41_9POAL|nr:hypothetical protein GQ55_8G254600 [Panicum hallii var. hallii]
MEPPPPPRSSSSSFHSLLQGLLALFAARPPVRDGCASTYDGAFLSAAATRRDEEDPNQRIGHVVKTCREGGSKKHSHDECILQLDTGLCPSPEPPPPRAILDSGAACHVAGDKSLFSPSSFRTVAAAAAACYRARDGRRLAVAGVGTVSWGSFQLPDVLYVPGLLAGVVLVSVPQLAERGYLVAFGGGQCYVQDRNARKTLGKGRLHGDAAALYHLEYLKIPPEPETTDSTAP